MANQPHDKPSGHHAESPAHVTMVSMFGAGADEHDVQPPGADPNAVRAGHEADRFGARAILYVPALVTITLIASYVMVTFVFGYLVNTAPNPRSENDPQVVQRNGAPINDRFGTISTWDPKPIAPSEPDTKVPSRGWNT